MVAIGHRAADDEQKHILQGAMRQGSRGSSMVAK